MRALSMIGWSAGLLAVCTAAIVAADAAQIFRTEPALAPEPERAPAGDLYAR